MTDKKGTFIILQTIIYNCYQESIRTEDETVDALCQYFYSCDGK